MTLYFTTIMRIKKTGSVDGNNDKMLVSQEQRQVTWWDLVLERACDQDKIDNKTDGHQEVTQNP